MNAALFPFVLIHPVLVRSGLGLQHHIVTLFFGQGHCNVLTWVDPQAEGISLGQDVTVFACRTPATKAWTVPDIRREQARTPRVAA